jgi:hypothetical protein
MRTIRNSALKIDKIPDPDGRITDWARFAHTINGYEVAGSFEECERLSNDGQANTLTELRCALFFMSRAERHTGCDFSDSPEVHTLLRKIRAKVIAREFD